VNLSSLNAFPIWIIASKEDLSKESLPSAFDTEAGAGFQERI
jgi:hypothetical protein